MLAALLYIRLLDVGRIITLRRVKACESGQAWNDKINNPRS